MSICGLLPLRSPQITRISLTRHSEPDCGIDMIHDWRDYPAAKSQVQLELLNEKDAV